MNEKLNTVQTLLRKNNLDAIAMIPSPNFFWLTGAVKHLMERPTVLIITANHKPALVIAGFEAGSMNHAPFEMDIFPFDDNPQNWGNAFQAAGTALGLQNKKIGIESMHLRFLENHYIVDNIFGCQTVAADHVFKQFRLHKTVDEVETMRKATRIAQNALEETLKIVKVGISEQEIASELVLQLLKQGSEGQPFNPIVASGPNSADPHSEVTTRKIQCGDFLLFDWGAKYKGYVSDITRTFVIGPPSAEQTKIYHTVLAANRAAFATAKVGVRCGDVDKVAREIIHTAEYGKYFTHRVGHGLGLESHEDPYMYAQNDQPLESGMCFTIEPGIYIPKVGGVRIEDDVVVTADGAISITDFPRELRVLCA